MTEKEILEYKIIKLMANPIGIRDFITSLAADKQIALNAVLFEMKTELQAGKAASQVYIADADSKLTKINI